MRAIVQVGPGFGLMTPFGKGKEAKGGLARRDGQDGLLTVASDPSTLLFDQPKVHFHLRSAEGWQWSPPPPEIGEPGYLGRRRTTLSLTYNLLRTSMSACIPILLGVIILHEGAYMCRLGRDIGDKSDFCEQSDPDSLLPPYLIPT